MRKNSTAIRTGNGWHGGLVEWEDGNVIYISVAFSWLLDKAIQRKVELMSQGKDVLLGGTAAKFAGIADAGSPLAVRQHNPDACFTSYGCPNRCGFCVVSQTEGDLVELPDWEPTGFPRAKISVYVLIGYEDTPEDALYRLEAVRRLGGVPFPMRYQPLDCEKRNSYVGDNWTHKELVRYCRYWANLRITSRIPFAEFVG